MSTGARRVCRAHNQHRHRARAGWQTPGKVLFQLPAHRLVLERGPLVLVEALGPFAGALGSFRRCSRLGRFLATTRAQDKGAYGYSEKRVKLHPDDPVLSYVWTIYTSLPLGCNNYMRIRGEGGKLH